MGYATITGGHFPGKSHAFAAPVTGLSLPGVGSSIPATEQNVLRGAPTNKTLRAVQPVPTKQQEAQAGIPDASPTVDPAALAAANAQEGAAVRAASAAPTPDLPPYQVYQVQPGDTVSLIATHFHLKEMYVTANNAEIQSNSDLLTLGQSIIVPAADGILHEVRYGETLSDIASRYDVDVSKITGFPANHISTADDITETQLVLVPDGKPIPVAPSPTAVSIDPTSTADNSTAAPEATSTPVPDDSSSSDSSSDSGGIVRGGARSGHGLIWPVVGPISSYYGPSHPLGIDIDGYNLAGAPIGAATSGTVTFAGGNSCCSYGLYVVVVSPGGIETLYGHLSSISVSQGQSVSQGEELGIIGNTGYSTGRHLHFEVIDNGVRVDPLSYLP